MTCPLCPRNCTRELSFCGETDFTRAHVAKTMLHRWEEPPVSGERGTGAVFFSGCNLRCIFCQNHKISQVRPLPGNTVDAGALYKSFLDLQALGAETISLISPTHVLPVAREAMRVAKQQSFPLKIVWNSNGYELPENIKSLAGLVDIYLPDLKYCDGKMAAQYSLAPDYFAYAAAAIAEMSAQTEVIIRHLILPGGRKDSMRVLEWIASNTPNARVSLMAQYTPMFRANDAPPLHRRLTGFEYDSVAEYAQSLGLKCFYQARASAVSSYTPDF